MDSKVGFDNVKFEKAKAMERFNRFRKITKIWQIFEVFLVFALVSWSSTRVSSVLKIYGHFVLEISSRLLNHHVVFLIGNVLIILLFVLCRESDAGNVTGTGDFSDDYVKHRETGKINSSVSERESTAPLVMAEAATVEFGGGDEDKKIIASPESMENDNVTMAIENASRQIKKIQMTQTEKLKREVMVKPRRELRRSETENFRAIVTSGQRQTTGITTFHGAEIDTLSNEEFQRTVDDEDKKIIVSPESMENDNVTMAIENASRQIKKIQRTKTEKQKREIAVKPRRELRRRSETENFRARVTSGQRQTTGITTFDGAEINTLSNEEFQRTVEAFIQKHWNKKLLN